MDLADDHGDARYLQGLKSAGLYFDGVAPLWKVQDSIESGGIAGGFPFQPSRFVCDGHLRPGYYRAGLIRHRAGDRAIEDLSVQRPLKDRCQQDANREKRNYL